MIIVGALIAAGPADIGFSKIMGFLAVVLASVNIFGGFIVTQRMLAMFKKKRRAVAAGGSEEDEDGQISSRARLSGRLASASSWRCAACRHPETARKGNIFGIVGMVIAVVTTLAMPGVVSYG